MDLNNDKHPQIKKTQINNRKNNRKNKHVNIICYKNM